MRKNFDFMTEVAGFHEVHEFCKQVEMWQTLDPVRSAQNGRLALETMMKIIYYLKSWETGEKPSLFDRVTDERFVAFIGDADMMKRVHYIRKVGNNAMHASDHKITKRESFFCLLNLYYFVGDILLTWKLIDDLPKFDDSLIPQNSSQIEGTVQLLVTQPAQIETITTSSANQVVNATNTTENPQSMHTKKPTEISEAETRKLYIDLLLQESGWNVLETEGAIMSGKACIEIEVTGMPTPTGKGYADYVLFADNGLPLAVVEAKKTSVDAIKGRTQAELYADCLAAKYSCPRPVVYYTNGFEHNVIDGIGYPPRQTLGFHTQDELHLLIKQRSRGPISEFAVNPNITDRKYQKRVIESVCNHFNDMHRRALLVMATGTGKTRVSISIVDVLVRNGWVKNVLFLADRRELVKQAKLSFDKLLPNITTGVLMDSDCDKTARILFSTYQTMIGYIDADNKELGIGRFDLVIIDEAHRSVFGKYGAIFNYFDALLLGLTATPRDQVDRSTYELFGMEQGVPTDSYEYREAVDDGYLVDYKTKIISSKIISEGIDLDKLTPEELSTLQEIFEYEKARKKLEGDGRDITPGEIFSYIYNLNTIDQVLNILMRDGLKINNGSTIGKTIIFAYNHLHAVKIVERFNALYPQLGADFCRVIDNYEKYADTLIDKFKVAGSMPQIAVSVDMLDTGIDVPEILNLVFFKPIHSKIKFDQMIGRGTRLCPDLLGPGKDKTEFYIFDVWSNFEYFKMNPQGAEAVNRGSVVSRIFELRTDIKFALQAAEYQEQPQAKAFHDELADILCKQVSALNRKRIDVRENLPLVESFSVRDNWTYISMPKAYEIKNGISQLLVQSITDISALQFDALILRLQLSLVDSTVKEKRPKNCVIEIAHALTQKASIPQVAQKMDVINKVLTEEFWAEKTLDSLEEVRKELRDLVQYLIEQGNRKKFSINIEDDINIDDGEDTGSPEIRTYRQRVMDYLKEHLDNDDVLKKIYKLEPLSERDIRRLEEIFWKKLGTKDEYNEQAVSIPFGESIAAFIRSIIGIDQDAALAKYRALTHDAELTRMQEEFLRTIIRYVCQNGDIRKEILANIRPFRDFNIVKLFGERASALVRYVEMFHEAIA